MPVRVSARQPSEQPEISDCKRGGNLRRSGALVCMDEIREKPPLSSEERAAKKETSRWDAMKALSERKKAEDAFRANYERLKAERLARESKS